MKQYSQNKVWSYCYADIISDHNYNGVGQIKYSRKYIVNGNKVTLTLWYCVVYYKQLMFNPHLPTHMHTSFAHPHK